MITLPELDSQLHEDQLGRWQHNETIITLIANQAKACYTMRLVKNGKKISEASSDTKNIGKLIAMLLDPVPIDPQYLKLN